MSAWDDLTDREKVAFLDLWDHHKAFPPIYVGPVSPLRDVTRHLSYAAALSIAYSGHPLDRLMSFNGHARTLLTKLKTQAVTELLELARSFDLDEKRQQLGPDGERALRTRALVRKKLVEPIAGTWISSERVTIAAAAMLIFNILVTDPFQATHFSLSVDAGFVPSLSITLASGRDTFAYRVPASAFYARVDVDKGEPIERGAQIDVQPVMVYPCSPLVVTVCNDAFSGVSLRASMLGRYLTDEENGKRIHRAQEEIRLRHDRKLEQK